MTWKKWSYEKKGAIIGAIVVIITVLIWAFIYSGEPSPSDFSGILSLIINLIIGMLIVCIPFGGIGAIYGLIIGKIIFNIKSKKFWSALGWFLIIILSILPILLLEYMGIFHPCCS